MEPQDLVPTPTPEARQWAMFCHYAAFFWFLVPMIGNVIGPLIVWQLKKDLDPFVNEQGKEALNFQITVMIGYVAAWILMYLLIGFLLIPILMICNLVFCILAAVAVSKGAHYRYPVILRLIK
jgi:uncharacterized Tic20 family protein